MGKLVGGYAWLWFIRIRPKYRNDVGILEHEKTHVRQFFRTCGLHGQLLRFRWYRLRAEVEAYREQLKHRNNVLQLATRLAVYYDLDITIKEAVELLKGY